MSLDSHGLDWPNSRMGRDQIIEYCKRLRNVIHAAKPERWVANQDRATAAAWQKLATKALDSHSTLDE